MSQQPHQKQQSAPSCFDLTNLIPFDRRHNQLRCDANGRLLIASKTLSCLGREQMEADPIQIPVSFPLRPNGCSPAVKHFLDRLAFAMLDCEAREDGEIFDLTELYATDAALVLRVLGCGRIKGEITLTDGVSAQISNTMMPQVWEVFFRGPEGEVLEHFLEVGELPTLIHQSARATPLEGMTPEWLDIQSFLPQLETIRSYALQFEKQRKAKVVLFKLDLQDKEKLAGALSEILGQGSIDIRINAEDTEMSLEFTSGECGTQAKDAMEIMSHRILSTQTRHVWLLHGFDGSGTCIQNILMVGTMPLSIDLTAIA